MENILQKTQEALTYIQSRTDFQPQYGIILGTGLGNLVKEIEIEQTLEYKDIPHFSLSTVESHSGKLIFGHISGKKIVAMQGRFHYYEGYSMQQVTFPVRVMKLLGIEKIMISNVSGSLNPKVLKGTIFIIEDHINLQPENPLVGKNEETFGPRFPDMSASYDKAMIKKAIEIAERNKLPYTKGVYVSVPGPNLETKAEYKYLRIIGGDVVGMSTVPEVIVANHMQLPVFAVSVVTDEGFHEDLQSLSLEEVIATAIETEPKMTLLMKELIQNL